MQIVRQIRGEEGTKTLSDKNVKKATFHKQMWKSQMFVHDVDKYWRFRKLVRDVPVAQ